MHSCWKGVKGLSTENRLANKALQREEATRIRERLTQLDMERANLEARLAEIEVAEKVEKSAPLASGPITTRSSTAEKVALFRSLFRGREDIYPKRWENAKTHRSGYAPACGNEWKPGICGKPSVRCGVCPHQDFLPVTHDVVEGHLRGRHTIGVYPMLQDDTCRFLAADFDKETWQRDAKAFLEVCQSKGVPAALERSRSGNGGHVWIFFDGAIPASLARRLGAHLLTEAMEQHPDIGFESYDRFFPSQDTMPTGGFGNLIALPLQHGPRERGNSVFVDEHFVPWKDQWAFLSGLGRLPLSEAEKIVGEAARQGRVIGLRLPLDDEDEEPWTAPPSGRKLLPLAAGPLPKSVDVVLADQIYIPRASLPPGLTNRLIRLAAFQNPAFYSAQSMRRSTFGIPRIVACAALLSHHLALPRGCQENMEELLEELGIRLNLRDERNPGHPVEAVFLGKLTEEQEAAADALLQHDTGVLSAATAFGKTVVAASLIAARKTNTLVLVHRRQLMDQWVARLGVFLDLSESVIGRIGGGKRKPSGVVDVAVIQSLVRDKEVDDIVADYGHLVVDECHHLSAVSLNVAEISGRIRCEVGRDGRHCWYC